MEYGAVGGGSVGITEKINLPAGQPITFIGFYNSLGRGEGGGVALWKFIQRISFPQELHAGGYFLQRR